MSNEHQNRSHCSLPIRLSGFTPSPSLEPVEESSYSGDDDNDDANGSNSSNDDEMTTSQ